MTQAQLSKHVYDILTSNPKDVIRGVTPGGSELLWKNGTLVILNHSAGAYGTVFRPDDGFICFLRLSGAPVAEAPPVRAAPPVMPPFVPDDALPHLVEPPNAYIGDDLPVIGDGQPDGWACEAAVAPGCRTPLTTRDSDERCFPGRDRPH